MSGDTAICFRQSLFLLLFILAITLLSFEICRSAAAPRYAASASR
jgi:hypothetical protein